MDVNVDVGQHAACPNDEEAWSVEDRVVWRAGQATWHIEFGPMGSHGQCLKDLQFTIAVFAIFRRFAVFRVADFGGR
jgi:hypothetical protein